MPEPVLPRCRVNVRVYGQDGIPEVGARVSATLNTFEVYQGYVVPQRYEGTTDEDGLCVLELFPNELGSVESNYRVKIVGTGGKSLVLSAVVPNLTEADLENCAVLPPFPGKVDGQLALDAVLLVGQQAQQAALDAQQAANEASTSATSAAVSSTAASDSAASAGAAAVSAGNSVTAASGFASSASGFADSAAASASAAASSATNANASAVAAAASLASFDPPTVVRTSGDQTIGGVKTFSSPPVVPAGATGAQAPQAQEIPTLVGITGAVVFYPATTAPPLWLKANGAAISRTTYAALWAYAQASGNLVAQGSKQAGNFGEGDGSTTFTLPDLRGEFPRGWDDGRGVDTGRAIGTAQAGEVQAHTHPVPYNLGNGTAGTNGTALTGNSASAGLSVYGGIPGSSSTGGAETRPRNVALLACIKY